MVKNIDINIETKVVDEYGQEFIAIVTLNTSEISKALSGHNLQIIKK